MYNNVFNEQEKATLIKNLAGALGGVKSLVIKQNMLALFYKIDPDYGTRLAKAIGVPLTGPIEDAPQDDKDSLKFYYDILSQPSRAIKTMLDSKNVPYEGITVSLMKGEQKSAENVAINPKGQIPFITIGGVAMN